MPRKSPPDDELKLGVIGLSPGNGHPYSWSAIINGFDESRMTNCPFPTIPEYLAKQKWPDAQIKRARVSHVHAPEHGIGAALARATGIQNVCGLEELSESVDAVLLARDDAKNHMHFAKPALQIGTPIYIDKPIAHSHEMLSSLLDCQTVESQIFTCSALTFSPEFRALQELPMERVSRVRSWAPKEWDRYGMHAVEPVVASFWPRIGHQSFVATRSILRGMATLLVRYEDGLEMEFACTGLAETAFKIDVSLDDRSLVRLLHNDTFYSFKSALETFIDGVCSGKSATDFAIVAHCVDLLERMIEPPAITTN